MSKQSTMKIIKQSKVKKAGGGKVVVADKLFTAIILLPEDMEKLIYSFLPTLERWGKEMILNRYGLPTFKQMIDAEFPLRMIDDVTATYTIITKDFNWLKEVSHEYLIPDTQRNSNIFLCYHGWHSNASNKIRRELLRRRRELLENADADYNMLRDTVLIRKYYLECKKRNDVHRKKYRAEYREMQCDADGLSPKKFRGRKRSIDKMVLWKSNQMKITEWVDRELKHDRCFADNKCYYCGGHWWTDGKINFFTGDGDLVVGLETTEEIKGESLPPFIIKSETSDAVITVVPDCRQCKRCQHDEIDSRVAITMYSF